MARLPAVNREGTVHMHLKDLPEGAELQRHLEAMEATNTDHKGRHAAVFNPVLKAKQRNALPASDFAEPGQRKYPINDTSHARNALARAAQHASPAEAAKIRAKVHKKYPGMGK